MIKVKRSFAPMTIEIPTEEDLKEFKELLYECLDKRFSDFYRRGKDNKLAYALLEQLK
jgi:hypothetical protein